MNEDSTILVARLAVAKGLVTQAQMDECLRLRSGRSNPPSIGEILLRRGLITAEQFQQLQELRTSESDTKVLRENEGQRFGRLVVSRGLATPEQVQECLKEQAELTEQGIHKNLGKILVDRKILTAEQVKRLLDDQDKAIAICPACREKYNVIRSWLGRSRCPVDETVLEAAESNESVGVAGPAEAQPRSGSPVGLEVGGCRILELIGRGASASVYRAKHLGLNRMVAVKLLSSVSKDPTQVKRLLLEARAIARLEHPNIVQVYDVGFFRGYFFMVMQLLKGETLSVRLNEWGGAMVEEQALAVVRDVARGLGAAHEKGIIHRDIKPDNVILTEDGKAKLTDFGLAQDVENPDEISGLVVGTPYYMSPEQWLGQKADERSDLYGLGCVFYLMMTGRRPFEGEALDRLMQQHLKAAPKPAQAVNPGISDGLEAILKKLLAKAPARRYQNVAEFLDDLGRYQRGESPAALENFGRMVRCGFCETANPAAESKCKVCGEPLRSVAAELTLAPRADEFKCPGCQEYVRKGSKSCPSCRKAFCVRCRKRLVALRGFCEFCLPHFRRR